MSKICLSSVKSLFPKKLFFFASSIVLLTAFFLSKPANVQAAVGDIYDWFGSWTIFATGYPGNDPVAFFESSGYKVLNGDGTIYNYNGSSWSTFATGYPGSNPIDLLYSSTYVTGYKVLDGSGVIYNYNAGVWATSASGYPGSNPVDFKVELGYKVLEGNGTIYNYNGSSWSTFATGYPGTWAVELLTWAAYDVVDRDGTIYRYSVAGGWTTYATGYPGTFSMDPEAGYYVLDANKIIYNYNGSSWSIWATGYPGNNPLDLTLPVGGFKVLEGIPRGILNVKIFNDLDGDGIRDAGEDFTTFGSGVGAVALNGNIITPTTGGNYTALTSASPAAHNLGLDPNDPTWVATAWSQSSSASCPASGGSSYTFSSPWYNTGSFSVVAGGIVTVCLGVRQPPPPGTLITKIFHDINYNGALNSGETFTDFTNQAEVRLDSETGTVISPNLSGDASTSVSSGSHTIFIKPLNTVAPNFWDRTRWDDCPCPSSSAAYTAGSSGWWRTGSVTVPVGGSLTVYLGIRQMAELKVQYFNDKDNNGQRAADGSEDFTTDFVNVATIINLNNPGLRQITANFGTNGIATVLIGPNIDSYISTDFNESYHWRDTKWDFTGDSPPSWQNYSTNGTFKVTEFFRLAPGGSGTIYLGIVKKDFSVSAPFENVPFFRAMNPVGSETVNVRITSLNGYDSFVDGLITLGIGCSKTDPPIIPGNFSPTPCPGSFTVALDTASPISLASGETKTVILTIETNNAPFDTYHVTPWGEAINLSRYETGHYALGTVFVRWAPWFQTQGGDVGSVGGFSVPDTGVDGRYNAIPGGGVTPADLIIYNSPKGSFSATPISSGGKEWFVDEGGNMGTRPGVYDNLWNSLKTTATEFTSNSIPACTVAPCRFFYNGNFTYDSATSPNSPNAPTVIFINGTLTINSNLNASGTHPIIFITKDYISIGYVGQINAYLVTDEFIWVGASGDLLTVRGGLIGNGPGAGFFNCNGKGGVCLNRNRGNIINETSPSEIIIWEPRYLALLRQVAGISKFVWTEIAP